MIRHAVLTGEFPTFADVETWVPNPGQWAALLEEADKENPRSFTNNSWAVGALQAAWSSIVHTPVPTREPCRHFGDALSTSIRIGGDTDTVGAIAGAHHRTRKRESAIR